MTDDRGGCLSLLSAVMMALASLFGITALFGGNGMNGAPSTAVEMRPPSIELVLALDVPNPDPDQVQTAQAVLEARMGALAQAGQVLPNYAISSDPETLQIVVSLAEGNTTYDAVLPALVENGTIELVDFSSVALDALQSYSGQAIVTTAAVARGEAARQPVFPTVIGQAEILVAEVQPEVASSEARAAVLVTLTQAGAERLGTFTEAHLGYAMAIVVNGVVVSTPVIQAPISSPFLISGNFTGAEAALLALQLSTGALPAPLRLERVEVIPLP